MEISINPVLPQHCNMDDRVCVNILIDELLQRDKAIRVHDGEEWVLEKAIRNKTKILESLSHSGYDMVEFDQGAFDLIYNNGSDDDPIILISDYTDNAISNEVYEAVKNKLGLT